MLSVSKYLKYISRIYIRKFKKIKQATSNIVGL